MRITYDNDNNYNSPFQNNNMLLGNNMKLYLISFEVTK